MVSSTNYIAVPPAVGAQRRKRYTDRFLQGGEGFVGLGKGVAG